MTTRILVVTGKVDALSRLQTSLSCDGYTFTWALTASQGRERLSEDLPELIVVDAEADADAGVDAVRDLRRCEAAHHVPILLGVEGADPERRSAGLRAGADEVVASPFDAALLGAVVRLLLRFKSVRLERDARQAELRAAREEQQAFFEALVHDFKNPIAVAQVNLAWIDEPHRNLRPEILEALQDAREGVERLASMIDDLAAVGVLDRAPLVIKREHVRVNELLDQAIKRHQKEAALRNVSLRLSTFESLDVIGDPALLRRVIGNLLETSLRHTPSSGKIQLSARGGRAVEIAVSSTGRPLDPDERSQLLGRPISSTSAQPPGRGGLGLYFCKRAVEAHAGEVRVLETGEWPTSMVLRLPAVGAHVDNPARPSP